MVKLRTLAQEALDELRSLVFELRPPDLERDGLCGALRKHVEVLRRLQQREIDLEVDDEVPREPARDREVLRIAQEALSQRAAPRAAPRGSACACTAGDGRSCWRSPTTGSASIPPRPACARAGWA